jgi:hypothetical protein
MASTAVFDSEDEYHGDDSSSASENSFNSSEFSADDSHWLNVDAEGLDRYKPGSGIQRCLLPVKVGDLFGQYEIKRKLDSGPGCTVWLAKSSK